MIFTDKFSRLPLILFTFSFIIFFYGCSSPYEVEDIDGNTYSTVKIGNQVWMAENLKVSKFKNDNPIRQLNNNKTWGTTTDAACCWYDNDAGKVEPYGRLYNWFAINDARGLAPEGWHIPTEKEIEELITYLKSDTSAAAKLKITGTEYWLPPNKGANNSSGFSALPGGYRDEDGEFHTLRANGYWWTETRTYEMFSWSERIWEGFADVDRDKKYYKFGFSVRCIKD
ncbi:fibrobacter succinogenes major paralogous domain-containing protein [Pedobacter sp. P351]|uniref:fibrobacter succinogenes major paralogous domain-containing protein n=1 Tax=Pedobacter superstes TaxID=3133441 RepID=UPI0030A01304